MITVVTFTCNDFQENTYLLVAENRSCILIDPGCYTIEERKRLQQYIEKELLQVLAVYNTHCHLDHVFGNHWAAGLFKVDIHIHPLEQPILEVAPQVGKSYGLSFEPSPDPKTSLEQGKQITLGQSTLTLLHTPGHSPGSVTFYCEQEKFIISGDVLFLHSIGRTDLPGGDQTVLLDTIKSKLLVLPDDVKVYPGHGYPTTIGNEKNNNPFIG